MSAEGYDLQMTKLVVRLLINTASLVIAAYFINSLSPGAFVIVDWQSALVAGVLFGLVNTLIRPLLFWFTCLLQIITLGLFTLVLNALLLMLTDWLAGAFNVGFQVGGFWPALWGAIVISIVSTLLTWTVR